MTTNNAPAATADAAKISTPAVTPAAAPAVKTDEPKVESEVKK